MKRRATEPGKETEVNLTKEDLVQIADVVTLISEYRWLALEEQQKVAVTTLQYELQALKLKANTLQISMVQARLPLATSMELIVMTESYLYLLLGTTLTLSPLSLCAHVQAYAEVHLDMARLPHKPLHVLHTSLFKEIQHRDHQVQ